MLLRAAWFTTPYAQLTKLYKFVDIKQATSIRIEDSICHESMMFSALTCRLRFDHEDDAATCRSFVFHIGPCARIWSSEFRAPDRADVQRLPQESTGVDRIRPQLQAKWLRACVRFEQRKSR